MKKYEVENVRNVGLYGHGGDGKTSLAEAILFNTGENNRLGRVDEGSSLMDYEPEETERKMTLAGSFAQCEWGKHKINLIDTPGDSNFIADAKACMIVVDGVILVLGANSGVKVKTDELWNLSNQLKIPRILYPGLEDDPGHEVALRQMRDGFGGVMAFEVGKTPQEAMTFISALHRIVHAVSLGATETLVCIPYLTTMLYLPEERRTTFGVEPNTVRLSAGIEPEDQLLADLEHALASV